MPMPFIPKPPFPNVPNLPGVPRLPRSSQFPPQPQGRQIDGRLGRMVAKGPTWGWFDSSGNLVLNADSVVDLADRQDSRVSYFPVEEGSFATYNKVRTPEEIAVRFAKGGHVADRVAFQKLLKSLCDNTTLYNVVTADAIYSNVNAVGYAIRRTADQGANLIVADVQFTEVRQVTRQTASVVVAAANPSGTPPVNNGKVQPAAPSKSILKSIAGKLGS